MLRGLHFQRTRPQGKRVRVSRGAVYDVAVDIDRRSPTCGQFVGVELNDDNHRQLWIPPGYAHGFCVLSEVADFECKCTERYFPDDEGGLLWNDPDVGIPWPIEAQVWPDAEFVQAVLAQLPWYHQLALLDKLDSPESRRWYRLRVADSSVLNPPAAQHGRYRWWRPAEMRESAAVHGNARAYGSSREGQVLHLLTCCCTRETSASLAPRQGLETVSEAAERLPHGRGDHGRNRRCDPPSHVRRPLHQHVVVNVAKMVNMRTDAQLDASVRACDIINIDGMGV